MENQRAFKLLKKWFDSIVNKYNVQITGYFNLYPERQADGSIIDRPILVTNNINLGMNNINIFGVQTNDNKDEIVQISKIRALTNATKKCFVESLFTDIKYQRKGYGGYCLNIVKNICKEKSLIIYGLIANFDEIALPEEYQDDNLRLLEVNQKYLRHYYKAQGLEVIKDDHSHTNRETGEIITNSHYIFEQTPDKIISTKTYPNEFLDTQNFGGIILNQNKFIVQDPNPNQ